MAALKGLPWLRSGERIETAVHKLPIPSLNVSPGFGQGSGLKRRWERLRLAILEVSPGFGQGSGLKLLKDAGYMARYRGSPLASVRGAD